MKYKFDVEMEMSDDGFKQLTEQKMELLHLLDTGEATEQINGVVHLIDHIQDTAVDVAEIDKDVVFKRVNEQEFRTICPCSKCVAACTKED